MKRDAKRRWRSLILVGALAGCCDVRVEAAADALRACLALALFGPDFDGCAAADADADLLLDACVCDLAKVTPFMARF